MRAKAKNQKLVSRAVKAAGFKNIKEAKMALKDAPKTKSCSSSECATFEQAGAAPKNVGETLGHTPKESRLRAAVRMVLTENYDDRSLAVELQEIVRQYELRAYLEGIYKQQTDADKCGISWFTVSF